MVGKTFAWLFNAAGSLAALFIAGIALSIVVQIACRFVGVTFDSTELAGFCLAAATFLGLAHTFHAGGHVRITLLIERLPRTMQRRAEIANCVIAGAATAILGWHALALAIQSFRFNDISPGLLAIPFWIPQAGMALGVVLLTAAILEELFSVLRGRSPRHIADASRPVASRE